jgi:hypothetical protein
MLAIPWPRLHAGSSILIANLFVKKQFVEKELIKTKENGINSGT